MTPSEVRKLLEIREIYGRKYWVKTREKFPDVRNAHMRSYNIFCRYTTKAMEAFIDQYNVMMEVLSERTIYKNPPQKREVENYKFDLLLTVPPHEPWQMPFTTGAGHRVFKGGYIGHGTWTAKDLFGHYPMIGEWVGYPTRNNQDFHTEFLELTKPESPLLGDVLHCLYNDSIATDGKSVDDFAKEFGYTLEDGISKIIHVYESCQETARRLPRLFGRDGYELLGEACQDY
jgi:hypothetical protein